MTSAGRYRAKEWSQFEECIEGNGQSFSKPKQKCKHCDATISSKIERLREHLRKCEKYLSFSTLKSREFVDSSDEDEFMEIKVGNQSHVLKDGESETLSEISSFNQPVASTSCTPATTVTVTPVTPHCKTLYSFLTSTPHKRSSSALSIMTNISDTESENSVKIKKAKTSILPSIDRFVQKTTAAEKDLLDLQFARTFYACNIPFNVADNDQMKKLISMLRHGSYKNPSREQLRTTLLDSVYDECKATLSSSLKGQQVTLIQDGWSNIHNQPVIGTCLHNGTKPFFIRSVDSGAEKKTAEYCANIAEQEIHHCETNFGCRVSNKTIGVPTE